MSQRHYSFKTNFEGSGTTNQTDGTTYDKAGQVRNICFVWLDGRRMFFNYAYLVSVDLDISGQLMNRMAVCFTSDTVLLAGYNLAGLFDLLIDHIPRIIVQIDSRYLPGDENVYQIIDMVVNER